MEGFDPAMECVVRPGSVPPWTPICLKADSGWALDLRRGRAGHRFRLCPGRGHSAKSNGLPGGLAGQGRIGITKLLEDPPQGRKANLGQPAEQVREELRFSARPQMIGCPDKLGLLPFGIMVIEALGDDLEGSSDLDP
jgi:hypothetical protein